MKQYKQAAYGMLAAPQKTPRFMMKPTHAITIIDRREVTSPPEFLTSLLAEPGVNVLDQRVLPVPKALSYQRGVLLLSINLSGGTEDLAAALDRLSEENQIDLLLQSVASRQTDYRLAVFDMDSTLIQCEVIDQLAELAGVGAAVAAITERAMRGELDFQGSFRERMAMLAGLEEGALAEVASTLPITEGMPEMVATLRGRGIHTAILSGGFSFFAEHLKHRYGFSEIHANTLDIVDGKVTGRVTGPIVDGERKRCLLEQIASNLGIGTDQVIAVGDGANDLPMLHTAGMGVAFDAKPRVREQAELNLRFSGLDGLLYLMGSGSELNPARP